MFLINFIQKIQEKPRHTRIKILWMSVLVCMFFISSAWIFSLKKSLSIKDDKNNEKNITIKDDTVSLKNAFKASIGSFFKEKEEEESKEEEIINNYNEPDAIKPARLPLSR